MATSIYERLGGEKAIDSAVYICYEKVLPGQRIKHRFAKTDMDRRRNHQKRFLTTALGGPSNYSGKAMRAAHKHPNLTEADFYAVSENLIATLNDLKVPGVLIDQTMTVVGSVKNDVLNLLAICSLKINVEICMMSFVRY
jgi:hemoglobin